MINMGSTMDCYKAESELAGSIEIEERGIAVNAYSTDKADNKCWERMADRVALRRAALNSLANRDLWPCTAAHILSKFFDDEGLFNSKVDNYKALRLCIWASFINLVGNDL